MEQHLTKLGLSPAALKAAILAELEDVGVTEQAEAIAAAVAEAIDANNQEMFRQLRGVLAAEIAALEPSSEPDRP